MRIFIAFALLLIISTSCIPLKEQVYFQGEISEIDSIRRLQNEPYRIQVNDILSIRIKSPQKELEDLFNKSMTENNRNANPEAGLYFSGYSVDIHGNIRLPYLNDVNVLGYTTDEVREKIEEEFEKYIKNPDEVFVTVQLAGVRFTVIGEVKKTGTYVVYLNQVNLAQALAEAEDITLTGNRKNVTIFRKQIDGTKRYQINMLDVNSFDSENFFVQSNDIIYVEPLKQKAWGTGTSGMQTITSLIAVLSLVTTTILLINNIK